MKWIVVAATLGLVVAALWVLAVRDRSFRTYDDVAVGMKTDVALLVLKHKGYLVSYPSEGTRGACRGKTDFTLFRAVDPTYSITLSSDAGCNITEIRRRLRRMEL